MPTNYLRGVKQYSASVLKKRIEFVRLVSVSDGGGGSTRAWLPLAPPVVLPAMIRPRSSRERFMSGQTASAETVLIVIRYIAGLSQTMRIRYGTRVYEILGMIDVDEAHEWIEIDAEERFGE